MVQNTIGTINNISKNAILKIQKATGFMMQVRRVGDQWLRLRLPQLRSAYRTQQASCLLGLQPARSPVDRDISNNSTLPEARNPAAEFSAKIR